MSDFRDDVRKIAREIEDDALPIFLYFVDGRVTWGSTERNLSIKEEYALNYALSVARVNLDGKPSAGASYRVKRIDVRGMR